MNAIAVRLLSQQLLCPQFDRAEQVVEWMGAMQAQEPQMMRWAVAMRTKRPSLQDFRRAFDEGRIIRTHLFRTTWQLVAAEDLRWMLSLCRDKNRRAIDGFTRSYGDAISEQEYVKGCDVIERCVGDVGNATKQDLTQALQAAGIAGDPHHVSILIRRAEIDGLICNGRLSQGRENTYALISERIPPQPTIGVEEAMMLLARKYFRSHSPATLEDFVWWTGLSTVACRRAVAALAGELAQERIGGEIYYVHTACRTRGFRRGVFHLLPSYDEYLIAYKSRHVALAPEHRHYAHDQKGIFRPVILHDGRVVGNWHPSREDCAPTFFSLPADADLAVFEKAVGRYRGLKNLRMKEVRD